MTARASSVAAAIFLLALTAGCGTGTSMPSYYDCVGVYRTESGASGIPGLEVTLYLNDDYTAEMSSDYQNGDPPVVETGTWIIGSEGTITVRLTEVGGVTMYPVDVMELALDGAILVTVEWDELLHGREGLEFHRIQ